MGRNPAHPRISPAPPPFIFLCTAQLPWLRPTSHPGLPQRRTQPASLLSVRDIAAQLTPSGPAPRQSPCSRVDEPLRRCSPHATGCRSLSWPRARAWPASVPCRARACPRLRPQRPTSFLRIATTESKRKAYPKRNSSWNLPQIRNKLFKNLWFGWRRYSGRCSARAGLLGLQIGAPNCPHDNFSPLPQQSQLSCHRPSTPKPFTPSHCWEDLLPSPPLRELFLEPEHHQRTPPLPLKIARAASATPAFTRPSKPP
jgi:hypothetical protein